MVQKILFMLIRTHDDVIRSLNEKEKIKQNNFGLSFLFEKKGFFEPKQMNVPILLQLLPGDLLLFGGDIVHRGENVKNQSFAIHFYCVDGVQTNLCTNDYDQTEFVDFTP